MPAVPPTARRGGRDHRVDFYRGIALAMIFVNHIPGNVWETYTSRNFGFSDAAELFVFLAGFASAFAYARPFLGGAPLVASIRAWRRAGVLYLVHITLTMAAIGLFSWGSLAFGRGDMMHQFGLEMFLTRPIEVLIGVIALTHQLGYVNILPMYSVILLMLPVHLLLARWLGRGGMLAIALAFWALTGVVKLNIPVYPIDGAGWFFNPFAWQALFAVGLYCGLAKWQRGRGVFYSPYLYGLALFYMFLSFLFIQLDAWGLERTLPLPVLIGGFDKTYVSVPRFAHLLAVVYVFAHMPKTSPLAAVSSDNPFTRLGRHSLPIFAVGTTLSIAAQVLRFGEPASFARDTAIVATGLALQFALARYLDWWAATMRMAARAPAEEASVPARAPVAAE